MDKEWEILLALFKATCEQQSMLIGQNKHNAKLIFNRWMKEGTKLMKAIEVNSDSEYLEKVTSKIENSIHEMR